MDILIQNLERHFQFCVRGTNASGSASSSDPPSTSEGGVGPSGSKSVMSTTQPFGQASIVQEDKARQENVRKQFLACFFHSVLF